MTDSVLFPFDLPMPLPFWNFPFTDGKNPRLLVLFFIKALA